MQDINTAPKIDYSSYDNMLKSLGTKETKERFNGWTVYKCKGFEHISLIHVSVLKKPINSYFGRLLFNIETKEICFGIKDGSEPYSMTAKTLTNKGAFWNGMLFIIVDIK